MSDPLFWITYWASVFTYGFIAFTVIFFYSYATFKLFSRWGNWLRIASLIPLWIVLGLVVRAALQYAFVVQLF